MTIELSGLTYTIARDKADGRSFTVHVGGRCAGFFSVEPATRKPTLRGWYANVAGSGDLILAVAEMFLRAG